MKKVYAAWCLVCATSTLALLAGCGHKKQDANTELEKAASVIAQGNDPQPAPPPLQAQPAPESPTPVPTVPTLAPTASQQMQQALTSYKTGQLEDAVTRLQKLRATPTLTAEQRMALQDGVAAVMAEIYAMAEKGDTRAIAAVRQYEQMQTAPH